MSSAAPETDTTLLPRVDQRQLAAGKAEYVLFVPQGLAWFDGHFDGMPVIPGVVLVHWAAHFAAEAFRGCTFSGEARQLKFRRLLLPCTTLELSLAIDRDRNALAFTFRSTRGEHCSGTLLLCN